MPHHTWAIAGILTLLILLAAREITLHPRGKLSIHFLDVGQGDSTLLVSPSGKQILIDGGPDFSALEGLGRHVPFFDRSLDLLVLTHPQRDHMRSFQEVLRRHRIKAVFLTGVAADLPEYAGFLELLREQRIPLLLADPSRDIDLGDGLLLDTVWPPPAPFGQTVEGDLNDTSIVLRALYRGHKILFTGDIEKGAEEMILATGTDVRSDIMKVAHHGSRTSSSTGFLLAVRPSLAIVSAGRNNRFGHPHREVVERYRSLGIPLRSTVEEGPITLQLR